MDKIVLKQGKVMNDIENKILKLCKEKNAIILAHNYQRDEVQKIATATGDSLQLARIAKDSDAEIIVTAGVYFMAETAAILSPDKKILIPKLEAGCPLAEMITKDDILKIKEDYPGYSIVTYVNSTSEVKSISDIVCTSSNAVNVVNNIENNNIFFTPDRNLAQWTIKHSDKNIKFWDGFCPVHQRIDPKYVKKLKKDYSGSKFVAHPECSPEVLELADYICSTSGLYKFVSESEAKDFIIGTEKGVLYKLKLENPDKNFLMASDDLVCVNMKKITIESILEALEKEQYVVSVSDTVRERALSAVEKMVNIT